VTGINVEHTAIQTVCNRCSFELDEEERIRKERARRAWEAWEGCGTAALIVAIVLPVGLGVVILLLSLVNSSKPQSREPAPEAEQKANAIIRSPEEQRLSEAQKDLQAVEEQLQESKNEEKKLLAVWYKPMSAQDAARIRASMKRVKKTIADLEQKRDQLAQYEEQLKRELEEARRARR
jgi:hypothetical protein